MKYDERHGGPWDRGCADSWYGRDKSPHYYKGDTYSSQRVEKCDMTQGELDAYHAGYDDNEARGCKKY